jgi:hypothetical protein
MNSQTNGSPRDASDDHSRVDAALKHSRALRQDAHALAGELRGAFDEIEERLDIQGRMERNPYATLAVAAGVGYVLGGGLFSRFTGHALRLGVRLMLVPMLKSELMALGEAAAEGMAGAEER